MGEKDLESVLNEVWEAKKSKRLIPLKKPTLDYSLQTSEVGTSYIDILSKEIKINPEFIKELKKNSVDYRNSLDAVIEHEIGHYFVMPYSLTVRLLEMAALKDMTDNKRDTIINYFDDVAVNLNIILQGNETSNNLGSVYKNFDEKGSKIGKLLRAYYKSFAKNIDFGADFNDLDNSLKEKFIALRSIDFNTRNKMAILQNISAFRRLIEDLVEVEPNGNAFDGNSMPIEEATEEEKEKALKELAGILKPEEYKYAYDILHASQENTDGKKVDPSIIEYYRNKALHYPIQVLGIPLINEETQKTRLSEWSPSDGVRKMNALRSGGKIIPGVTKQWVDDKYYTYGQKRKIPDCIITIDSSGSMERISSGESYAAIAAVSAAIQYINNGAKVDVVNFSSAAEITKYQSEKGVLEAILEDQQQGTNFPYAELQKLLHEGNKDLIVISDGMVDYEHLTNFLGMVNKIGKNNRNSFIYIRKDDPSNYDYNELTNTYRNIRFHVIKEEADIPNLVLGDTSYGSK